MEKIVLARNVTFGIFGLGYLFLLLAFSTDNWGIQRGGYYPFYITINMGLWNACSRTRCTALASGTELDYIRAQMSIALILNTIALCLYIAWMAKKEDVLKANGTPQVAGAAMGLSITGAMFNAIAFIHYAIIYAGGETLSWSYGMSVVSGVVIFFNSTISSCVVGKIRSNSTVGVAGQGSTPGAAGQRSQPVPVWIENGAPIGQQQRKQKPRKQQQQQQQQQHQQPSPPQTPQPETGNKTPDLEQELPPSTPDSSPEE